MSQRRRFSVGMAWMFAGNWVEQTCNFVIFVIMARLLGAEAFGLAMMATVFIIFAEFLVRETFTEGLIQQHDLEAGHLDAAFWSLALLAAVLMLLLDLGAGAIAALYGEPRIAGLVLTMSPTVLFIALAGVPVATLRRELRFHVLSIRAMAGVILGGVVGIAMALADLGVWSLVGQRLVQVFVNSALAWLGTRWWPGWRARASHYRDVLTFGAKMVGLRASELVSVQTPTMVIGAAVGATALGQFSAAWRVVDVLAFLLVVPIRMVAQPAFGSLRRAGGHAGELLSELSELASLIAFPAFIGLAVLAGPAVLIMFGPGWEGAAPVLRVLCLVGIFLSVERLQQAFFLAMDRAGTLFAISALEAGFGIAVMLLMAPYGVIAIAAAFTARYLVLWPLRFAALKSLSGTTYKSFAAIFLPPLLAALLMAGAVLGWLRLTDGRGPWLVFIMAAVVLGISAYAGVIRLAAPNRVRRALRFVTELMPATGMKAPGRGVEGDAGP